MASSPDDANRRHAEQAAALALLLAAPRTRYSLPALIRAQGIRPKAFRQIRPTAALKYDLAAPYYAIVRAWAEQAPSLIAAQAGGAAVAERAVVRSSSAVAPVVSATGALFPRIVQNIERWHRGQWVSRVKASTGLDVSMFTQPGDVSDAMDATIAWNRRLAADVSAQIEQRIATEALTGGDVAARIKEAVARAKQRAAGIGDDQADKLSRAMDRSRREAAGVTSYVWHHTEQLHPRPHHLARDGRTFGPGDVEDSDRAGVPPFCKCWESPAFNP